MLLLLKIKTKLIFFIRRFLKTTANFLQKLFLTTSSGITFCSEIEEPQGTSQVWFLDGLLLEAGERGREDFLNFPLNCQPWGQLCCSPSLKVLNVLFSVEIEFKEQLWEWLARQLIFLSSKDICFLCYFNTTTKYRSVTTALCIIPILTGNISIKL